MLLLFGLKADQFQAKTCFFYKFGCSVLRLICVDTFTPNSVSNCVGSACPTILQCVAALNTVGQFYLIPAENEDNHD